MAEISASTAGTTHSDVSRPAGCLQAPSGSQCHEDLARFQEGEDDFFPPDSFEWRITPSATSRMDLRRSMAVF